MHAMCKGSDIQQLHVNKRDEGEAQGLCLFSCCFIGRGRQSPDLSSQSIRHWQVDTRHMYMHANMNCGWCAVWFYGHTHLPSETQHHYDNLSASSNTKVLTDKLYVVGCNHHCPLS